MHDKFWESHRVLLPEMREKAVNRCCECRFFIYIQGVNEVRSGCLASVEGYKKLLWKAPDKITLREILNLLGEKGLEDILKRGSPDTPACGYFQRKLKVKP